MTDLPDLTDLEKQRYSRHLILPEVGMEGQRRLKGARVLVVGAGGLGSPSLLYLAAAGVGTLGVIDFDNVDLSNLQRQILHSTDEIGNQKTASAERRIKCLNPEVDVEVHDDRLSVDNGLKVIEKYDIVVDGTDNFSTRYLVNDACVLLGKANVYGSIYRFEGQASVFFSPQGPCYRCLFPNPPAPDAVPNCAEGGVLGVLAGVIGAIQATEAIKLILDHGDSLMGRLLLYDATDMRFESLKVSRNKSCPICGDSPTIRELSQTAISCSAQEPSITDAQVPAITPEQLSSELKNNPSLKLVDVRNKEEYELCRIENSTLIPLPELSSRIGELERGEPVVVYCRSGNRSRKAAKLLLSQGFTNVRNLEGGILAWADDIDQSLTRY